MPKLISLLADERCMEQPCGEPPRRVTPTEARAKLLRSLVAQPEPKTNEADRKKLEEAQLRFIRALANQP